MERRKTVEQFADLMEQKLLDNDHKGGWENCDVHWLTKRMMEEVGEMVEALAGNSAYDVAREAADVAIFAMMIADNVGGIEVSAYLRDCADGRPLMKTYTDEEK